MFFSTYLYLIFVIIFYFYNYFYTTLSYSKFHLESAEHFFLNSADDFASLKWNDKNNIGVVRDDDKPY